MGIWDALECAENGGKIPSPRKYRNLAMRRVQRAKRRLVPRTSANVIPRNRAPSEDTEEGEDCEPEVIHG